MVMVWCMIRAVNSTLCSRKDGQAKSVIAITQSGIVARADLFSYFSAKIAAMHRSILFLWLVFSLTLQPLFGQSPITEQLYETYERYREPSLTKRRIKHDDIQPLLQKLKSEPGFEVRQVGTSIQGRSLNLVSIGIGETDVFLWSQMHGDEPTATMAIFDILNFLASNDFEVQKLGLLSRVRLHFLPMLNPDGAELFRRRNALGIDVNRDALRLQSPEGRTLKAIRDSLDADFGFNLHDQSRYYNALRTDKTATISYLAPAYDYAKSVNTVRSNAMKVIVMMNRIIQKYAPGRVGRYSDAFEPRAFGDNLQKWGTSTILIESGGYPGDREKQEIRKLNYVSILSAIFAIADGSFTSARLSEYNRIPWNDRKLFDLKLENLNYPLLGNTYRLDVGIHHYEVDLSGHEDFYFRSQVADQGDLSTYFGYTTLDCSDYTLQYGRVYPRVFTDLWDLSDLDFAFLLRQGYTYFKVASAERNSTGIRYPAIVVPPDFEPSPPGGGTLPTTFLLNKDGQTVYAVVNGFLLDLRQALEWDGNGLIQR